MSWSGPPERSQFSIVFLVLSALLLLTAYESSAATVDCEVLDTVTYEKVESRSINTGETWKVPRNKMKKYLPKGVQFIVAHQGGRTYFSETKPGIKKNKQVTNEYVRNVYPELKYSIECTHPYSTLPPVVESKKSGEQRDS